MKHGTSSTGDTQAGEKKSFKDQSPKEVREKVKEGVQKIIATAAGAIEGLTEEMKKNDLPQKAKEAVQQMGDTTRSIARTGREEMDRTREAMRGGGSQSGLSSGGSEGGSTSFRPAKVQEESGPEPESVRHAREQAKEKVQKSVATVAGAVTGAADQMRRSDLPHKAEEAMKQVGETTRNLTQTGKEQMERTKEALQGGSSSGSSGSQSGGMQGGSMGSSGRQSGPSSGGMGGGSMYGGAQSSETPGMTHSGDRESATSSGRPFDQDSSADRDASGGLQRELGSSGSQSSRPDFGTTAGGGEDRGKTMPGSRNQSMRPESQRQTESSGMSQRPRSSTMGGGARASQRSSSPSSGDNPGTNVRTGQTGAAEMQRSSVERREREGALGSPTEGVQRGGGIGATSSDFERRESRGSLAARGTAPHGDISESREESGRASGATGGLRSTSGSASPGQQSGTMADRPSGTMGVGERKGTLGGEQGPSGSSPHYHPKSPKHEKRREK